MSTEKDTPKSPQTRITLAGRPSEGIANPVNPAAHRASTILVDKAADLYRQDIRTYGLHGSPAHDGLKEGLCALENAEFCTLVESGLLACTLPILALVGPGEHVLIPNNAYTPTRQFCNSTLKRLGGVASYYHPQIGSDIVQLITDKTRLILIESPGSLTFEMPDIRAIVATAKTHNIPTALDNSWASGVALNPLDLGVDLSLLALSKYIAGHSDLIGGAILTNSDELQNRIYRTGRDLGLHVSADDAYLALRGLRNVKTRFHAHDLAAREIAQWLQSRENVERVLHPALPDNPDNALWKRDFKGAAGLFSFVLKTDLEGADEAFLNALELFGLGFSYGGFESLAIHCAPQLRNTGRDKEFQGPLIRLAIGLEDVDDLKRDLDKAFRALRS